ncbi:MAG: peptidoglycan DD-metalloendopeptidase family protein [Peptostreptococcaceae bacterium]|nr:peptidoglycan DD-metalloendopeptidase family protein [Peptostreptococcaceae bacterium]
MVKLKKTLALIMVFTLVSVTLCFDSSHANEITDKQKELNEISDKKDETTNELESIVEDIELKTKEIDEINGEIATTQEEISETTDKLEKKQIELLERQDGIEARIRAMYKNGTVGFIDIIFSSTDITEFMSNVEMIKNIYEFDKEVLAQLEDDYNEIQGIKVELEASKSKLDTEKSTAVSKKAELDESKKTLEDQLDQFNKDAEGLNSEITRLQKEALEKYGEMDTSAQGMLWPTTTRYVTSPYGWRIHPVLGYSKFHSGIDIGVGSGNPIYAVKSGVVILSQYYYGYGYAVILDHGNGLSTLYGHCSSLKVSKGQTVTQGQTIALSGSTGISTGPHLHFEVRVNGSTVDPMSYY